MLSNKKVLFIIPDFERGGIPRVALNLIAVLDPQKVSVDLFCGNPQGIYREASDRIPHVHVLPKSWLLQAIMCNFRKERGWFKYYALIVKVFRFCIQKIFSRDILRWLEYRIGNVLSKVSYDVVFACSEGLPADIALKIATKKRCVWIHNDYDHDNSVNAPGLFKKLKSFDTIICVAEHARISLNQHFPAVAPKTCTVYNIVNEDEIRSCADMQSEVPYIFSEHRINIVSIGRFYETQKNFSRIPQLCSELKKRGISFCWYLIGNGSPLETKILSDAIKEFNPGETFVILGEKSNPYPYLKKADLFALTSRYETYPTVINEAKALGCPIISTDFKGVDEIMTANDGIVVPIDRFADAIEQFCKNRPGQKKNNDFGNHNRRVLKQIYQIIEE